MMLSCLFSGVNRTLSCGDLKRPLLSSKKKKSEVPTRTEPARPPASKPVEIGTALELNVRRSKASFWKLRLKRLEETVIGVPARIVIVREAFAFPVSVTVRLTKYKPAATKV